MNADIFLKSADIQYILYSQSERSTDMNITYTNVNGYQIPNLKAPKLPDRPIGIYGRMRRKYLKASHPTIYSAMMIKGIFLEHLADVEEACQNEIAQRVKAMAETQGITEELKKHNQLKWVGIMNNIRQAVKEQVLNEFVYPEEARV